MAVMIGANARSQRQPSKGAIKGAVVSVPIQLLCKFAKINEQNPCFKPDFCGREVLFESLNTQSNSPHLFYLQVE
jgi:hypothetical protein